MLDPRRFVARLLALGFVFILAGCSRDATVTELPQGEKNLRIIARAYTRAAQSLGHSPKSTEELKPFLKDYGNPDELLVSPNDGKPYVIVASVDVKKPRGSPVLAFEQEGKNGKRQYVDLRLYAQTATEEEFARLQIPSGQKPTTRE